MGIDELILGGAVVEGYNRICINNIGILKYGIGW